MNVLVVHGYSASNMGDGLLVDETLQLIKGAVGESAQITLCVTDPDTFAYTGLPILNSRPSWRLRYLRFLARLVSAQEYDLVVAVGGGYLRFGGVVEALKTTFVHGPQLVAASLAGNHAVYLPQSVGPLRFGSRIFVRAALMRMRCVFLRDDRSVEELNVANSRRIPDLAVLSSGAVTHDASVVNQVPVVSVRNVDGIVPEEVMSLCRRLGTFDGYIQSSVGGNDDVAATAFTRPRSTVSREDLIGSPAGPRRVVVAVRLHAALMALNAGHFVVHLAYERKGFGAFQDLGLEAYVHDVRHFDAAAVEGQVRALLEDEAIRHAYAEAVQARRDGKGAARRELTAKLQEAARTSKS